MAVNYAQVIAESRAELKEQIGRRDHVDKRITELRRALRALVSFVADENERQQVLKEVADARRIVPSLNDAIVDVLSRAPEGLSGAEIRDQLDASGFELDDYSQPLATILTTLQRLVDTDRVKRGFRPDGKVGVFRLPPRAPVPPESMKKRFQKI